LNILVQHPGRQFKAIEGRRTPFTTPLPPAIPHSYSFNTDTLRNEQTTIIQDSINQVNSNGLKTHPVIVTAPFGIRLDPIQQNGSTFEMSILLNTSIIHIDPQRELPAICAGHIILTFISNTIELVLTNNLSHPNKPIITSEPSSTQPDPDNELNLLYLTPPPSPASLSSNQHEGADHGTGMLNEQLPKQPDTFNTTSTVVDDQFNYLQPKPLPSLLDNQPGHNQDSKYGLDHDIYYSTTHWPSDQQQSYHHQHLSTH
jgi:hypothetical protein